MADYLVMYLKDIHTLEPAMKEFPTREEAWQFATEIVADQYPTVYIRDLGNPYLEKTINVECYEGHWTAMFAREPQGVKGCPLGSSDHSYWHAVEDLLVRTYKESGVDLFAKDFTINIRKEET